MGLIVLDAGAVIGVLNSADAHHQASREAMGAAVRDGLALDALVIATAQALGADAVLTTDRRWPPGVGVPVRVVGGHGRRGSIP